MIQKASEKIKGRSQTSWTFFDFWLRFMKASRIVSTSTVTEYSFIGQRLFIERLINFDYSFGPHSGWAFILFLPLQSSCIRI